MGRGGRARTQRKHFRQHRENIWKRTKSDPDAADNNDDQASNGRQNPTWTPFATENSSFDEYYMEQGILSKEEWKRFMEVLRSPLPASFRINSSSQFCTDIQLQLENDFMKSLQTEVIEGGEADAIRPLPWYPGALAWHSNFSRMQLRKNQTLERFHEFLKLENEIGNITRQEAVSMVPPLFLDVHPEHFVLDMCAAPGSKTFQLLEIIHQTSESRSLPRGLVLANDLDVQRCNLLIHQTKRMSTANLIVTNHEAQHFPGCRLIQNHSVVEPDQGMIQLLFDRVLCDVPCSGDGTLRKAPDLWRKWNAGMGNGLHSLQVQIALRGMSLLRVGGRLVYSTCSMNPVENEAVVSEILRRCGKSVELVDVSNELPHLIRRPGLRKWKVRDKGNWLVSYKNVGKYRRSSILPSMFPSGRCNIDLIDSSNEMCIGDNNNNNDDKASQDIMDDLENAATAADENDEVSEFPLERCMRIVPHDQNTGAFFIAVFHKVSSLPVTEEKQKTPKGNDALPKESLNQSIQNGNGSEVKTEVDTDAKVAEAALGGDTIDDEHDRMGSQLNSSDGELNTEASKHCDTENESKKTYGKRKLQIQGKWKGVDPVLFFNDEVIVNSIKTFYGINESFPFNGHLVTRNSDAKSVKRIYYVSKSVKDVLELNFSIGQPLKIASIGLKMFERQSSREGSSAPCAFRISSEGLPLILPYISKQILCASPMDFKHLLQYKAIRFADFVDAEFGEKASTLMLGCCVIVLGKGDKASLESLQVDESTIAIGCWKGRASLTVMVSAIDCQELLQRLSVRMEVANDPSNMEMRVSTVVTEATEIDNEDNVAMEATEIDNEDNVVMEATEIDNEDNVVEAT